MKKTLFIVVIMLFVINCSGCIDDLLPVDKPFETSKVGEVLASNLDGSLVKIHKDYIMFDSGGNHKDDICMVDRNGMKDILENGETIDNYTSSDYYNLGETCFEGLVKTIYSSEDYIVIIPVKDSDDFCVIECNKKINESIKHYKKTKNIPIEYKNFTRIDCSYYSN